ncbi:DUF3168 domain-containing protein [Paenirhodobacter enshiensis]|uniref:DUF3168 domain-containing protein n=1 Tax=Paenirhodobacter enshiensis TaxID=1105367 RepID=UPI0035AFED1B
MSADLELQKAIRAALVADGGVTALVPASKILDMNAAPAPNPSIILGESQVIDNGSSLAGDHAQIIHTLHIWKEEASLVGVKGIASAIRGALAGRLSLPAPYHVAGQKVASARFLRDPDGVTSHGVVTLEVLISGDAP